VRRRDLANHVTVPASQIIGCNQVEMLTGLGPRNGAEGLRLLSVALSEDRSICGTALFRTRVLEILCARSTTEVRTQAHTKLIGPRGQSAKFRTTARISCHR
jgi:hypothetical protein